MAPPPLRAADVLACSFPVWYPVFHQVSLRATVLRVPDGFRDYLLSDGITLPEGADETVESQLSDSEEDSAADSDDEPGPSFAFPELDQQIRRTIQKYGGSVFPKLNWSSPQDAAFMLPGRTLECKTPADVYMLLKSSDFIVHDLEHAFDECVDAEAGAVLTPLSLVLKKHFDISSSQEWRCFVRNKRLVGISQRDLQYYDFMHDPDFVRETRLLVSRFFQESIVESFPLDNYVFDVYIASSGKRVFVVDFNPYGPQTDSLFFSWDELERVADSEDALIPVRVTSLAESQSTAPRFAHNQYPKDAMDLSTGENIAEFARKWNEALVTATVE